MYFNFSFKGNNTMGTYLTSYTNRMFTSFIFYFAIYVFAFFLVFYGTFRSVTSSQSLFIKNSWCFIISITDYRITLKCFLETEINNCLYGALKFSVTRFLVPLHGQIYNFASIILLRNQNIFFYFYIIPFMLIKAL